MKTFFRTIRIVITFICTFLLLSSCNKAFKVQNTFTAVTEEAFNQIEAKKNEHKGVSGITSQEIISNAPIFYANDDATTEVSYYKETATDTYPLIQAISPIIQPDTIPITATTAPIVSKETNTALILGIISLVIPFTAIFLAPIGITKAKKAKKQILDSPEKYTGMNQVQLAIFLNILSLVFFVLYLMYIIFVFIFLFQIFGAI